MPAVGGLQGFRIVAEEFGPALRDVVAFDCEAVGRTGEREVDVFAVDGEETAQQGLVVVVEFHNGGVGRGCFEGELAVGGGGDAGVYLAAH